MVVLYFIFFQYSFNFFLITDYTANYKEKFKLILFFLNIQKIDFAIKNIQCDEDFLFNLKLQIFNFLNIPKIINSYCGLQRVTIAYNFSKIFKNFLKTENFNNIFLNQSFVYTEKNLKKNFDNKKNNFEFKNFFNSKNYFKEISGFDLKKMFFFNLNFYIILIIHLDGLTL
jgi:hypothetical protein